MADVHFLVFSALLAWLMIMVAAELHTPTWTSSGAKLAFGNRDHMPERSTLAARADRAAKNMVENLVVFVALFAAARFAGGSAKLGSEIFFFARLAYFGLYLAGVVYARTLAWAVSLFGLLLLVWAAVG
jgi:uncharacterized MAPEG superfamily protein